MALPLAVVAVAWILLLSLVVALCRTARRGDRQGLYDEPLRIERRLLPASATRPASSPSRGAGYPAGAPAGALAQAGGASG